MFEIILFSTLKIIRITRSPKSSHLNNNFLCTNIYLITYHKFLFQYINLLNIILFQYFMPPKLKYSTFLLDLLIEVEFLTKLEIFRDPQGEWLEFN